MKRVVWCALPCWYYLIIVLAMVMRPGPMETNLVQLSAMDV